MVSLTWLLQNTRRKDPRHGRGTNVDRNCVQEQRITIYHYRMNAAFFSLLMPDIVLTPDIVLENTRNFHTPNKNARPSAGALPRRTHFICIEFLFCKKQFEWSGYAHSVSAGRNGSIFCMSWKL